jgi:hypothetical protein
MSDLVNFGMDVMQRVASRTHLPENMVNDVLGQVQSGGGSLASSALEFMEQFAGESSPLGGLAQTLGLGGTPVRGLLDVTSPFPREMRMMDDSPSAGQGLKGLIPDKLAGMVRQLGDSAAGAALGPISRLSSLASQMVEMEDTIRMNWSASPLRPGGIMPGLRRAALDAAAAVTGPRGPQPDVLGPAEIRSRVNQDVLHIAELVVDTTGEIRTGRQEARDAAIQNLGEGAQMVWQGMEKVVAGNFGEGLKDMALGQVKIYLQTPADAALYTGGKTISALQEMVGLESEGRELTAAEEAELRKVYGDAVDYSEIRVKEGHSGILTLPDRGFCLGNTIYLPPGATDQTPKMDVLVHEVGHAWQYQHGGTDYLSEALVAQLLGQLGLGPGYDYSGDLAAGASFDELNPEQQAQLVQDAYHSGYFDDPENNQIFSGGVNYSNFMYEVYQDLLAGEGMT